MKPFLVLVYISYVAKARLFTAVFSQLRIFTADCLGHPIQMACVETIWELHTLSVIYSCPQFNCLTELSPLIANQTPAHWPLGEYIVRTLPPRKYASSFKNVL